MPQQAPAFQKRTGLVDLLDIWVDGGLSFRYLNTPIEAHIT